LSQVATWQKDHPGEDGGEISIPDVDEKIQLPVTPLNLPQLQRIRRQFIALNRVNTFDMGRVGPMFVGYLNDAFRG
jgi:protein KTI12